MYVFSMFFGFEEFLISPISPLYPMSPISLYLYISYVSVFAISLYLLYLHRRYLIGFPGILSERIESVWPMN